jgi:nitroimidazol reductase NimA-like FMN-containing flavoprotein (pyridoxamine 5'-phosphate oxidase superfamily)
MAELQHLDRVESLQLLAANRFGRLAVSVNGQAPTLRPVNYVFDEPSQSVIFRTGQGSKLYGLLASRKAAFEIDGIDLVNRTGWSVVVRGLAEEILDPRELRRLARMPLDLWAPGDKPHWIRIRAGTVTGRRLVEPEAFAVTQRQ